MEEDRARLGLACSFFIFVFSRTHLSLSLLSFSLFPPLVLTPISLGRKIGQVLAELHAQGLEESTVVFIASDNGQVL